MMKIKNRSLTMAAYFWIYAAIFTFLLGYLKWYIGIPSVLVVGFALFVVWKKEHPEKVFLIHKSAWITACIVIPVWMILSGQGGFFSQLMDWSGRNAILRDMVERPWPVYYSDGSALTYYIGHFLVPAAAGKFLGLTGAKIVLLLYSCAGVFITWLFLVKVTRADTCKKQLFVLLVFIFFGSLENLRVIMTNFAEGFFRAIDPEYTKGYFMIGFTSNAKSMSGVFNQIIFAFLAIALYMEDDEKLENIFVLGVPMLIFSPFPLMAFLPLVLAGVIRQAIKNKNQLGTVAKKICSIQNILIFVVLAPVLLLYLWGNISGEKPQEMAFHMLHYGWKNIWIYVVFVLCEFIPYSVLLWTKYKKDVYFWVANLTLLILPLFQMGLYNDLCTRASSVGMFVLMIYIICFLFEERKDKIFKRCKTALACLLIFAMTASVDLYFDIAKKTSELAAKQEYESREVDFWHSLEGIRRLNQVDSTYNFFTFNASDDVFYHYLAKSPKE